MGYDDLNFRRFRPFAIAAALLGLALGIAMPLGPIVAGVPSDTTETKQVLASKSGKTDGTIVVAGKDKNWHNNKNWNKNWNNNKKVVVVRPYRKWYKRPYYGTAAASHSARCLEQQPTLRRRLP